MSVAPLEAAVASTRSVLAGVSEDQMDDRTPCTRWTVRDLVNHIVNVPGALAAALSGRPAPADDIDNTEGDVLAAYDDNTAKCLAALSADGALEATHSLPFGDMSGFAVMGITTTDLFTHGWDLARATDQSTDLDPQLAVQLLEQSRSSIRPEFRSEDGAVFGPEQGAPAGAPAADQLAAFLGRTV